MTRPLTPSASRLTILDGWRGVSILLVLASHLLPLGRKSWELNFATGVMGMAIFFTLSGFLITRFLLTNGQVAGFLIRRVFRIVPLAWLAMAAALLMTGSPAEDYLPNFFFYANWPPMHFGEVNAHFWSLNVEMQFYLGIALLVLCLRRHWPVLIPALCVSVTLYRAAHGAYAAVATWYRIDEIFAGSLLALIHHGHFGELGGDLRRRLRLGAVQLPLLMLFLLSCHPALVFLNYFRPYLAAALVGATLFSADSPMARALDNRLLRYFAATSYALYVIHPLLAHTWLGAGEGMAKYLRRPLLFAAVGLVAHLSTFHYERWWNGLGRTLARRAEGRAGHPRGATAEESA